MMGHATWRRIQVAISVLAPALVAALLMNEAPAAHTERSRHYSAARDGLVASSRVTPAGVTTRISAEDGSTPTLEFRSPGGAAALEAVTAQALERYWCMVAAEVPAALVPYDTYGCDAPADGFTCTSAGGCCDTHDDCYAQHGCTGDLGGWTCAAASACGTSSPLCAALAVACFNASAANQSQACKDCNTNAASCFGGAAAGFGPGKSSCCGRTDDQACEKERCTQSNPSASNADGSCDKPCTEHSECGFGSCTPWGCDNGCDGPGDCSNGGVCEGGTCKDPHPPHGMGCGYECQFLKRNRLCLLNPVACFLQNVVGPVDPNEMQGPPGTGAEQAVERGVPMAYQVLFENMAPATATAQEVVIVNYLDASLDWSTLAFGEINYGGRAITIPAGTTTFTMTDVPPNDGCMISGTATGELAVQITLGFNAVNGRIELRLKVIDTATGDYPADVFAGILPPDGTVCADGHFSYAVTPRADAASGTIITNSAAIVFDTNPAVVTNEWWNTLL